jgi:hypothetical protein
MTLTETVPGQFIADVHTGVSRHAPSLPHAGEGGWTAIPIDEKTISTQKRKVRKEIP